MEPLLGHRPIHIGAFPFRAICPSRSGRPDISRPRPHYFPHLIATFCPPSEALQTSHNNHRPRQATPCGHPRRDYAMRSSLEDVPDEIIRHILLYLPPEHTLASFQLVSRRYHHLANEPLLWRWHCQHSFRYWNLEHQFQERLTALASSVDWRGLWTMRKRGNSKAARLLDGIILTKVGQLKRMQGICELGYDVKDYLLEQCHADESAEDVLARR